MEQGGRDDLPQRAGTKGWDEGLSVPCLKLPRGPHPAGLHLHTYVQGIGSGLPRVANPAGCVTLGKGLMLSVPQFPHISISQDS